MAHHAVEAPLLVALGRLHAGVMRKARWRKIGEIRTVPDRRVYQRAQEEVEASLLFAKSRYPEEEHYCLFPPAQLSEEDTLTLFLEKFMREAKPMAPAQQLKLDL